MEPVEKGNKIDEAKAAKMVTRQAPENKKRKTLQSKKESSTPKPVQDRLPLSDQEQPSVDNTDGEDAADVAIDEVWELARRKKKAKKVAIDQFPQEESTRPPRKPLDAASLVRKRTPKTEAITISAPKEGET